jgi:hypothetical protein
LDAFESVVLRFFVGPGGEFHCRAVDVSTRKMWVVRSAADIHRLLHKEPNDFESGEPQHEDQASMDRARGSAGDRRV